jgi:2-methylcitrate dehydratase PrpD
MLDFILRTTWTDLPPAVQAQTVRCLLDTLGAALAGRQTETSHIMHDFAAQNFGGRGGWLWQDGREVSPAGAALANAATIDALDIHDGHTLTKGHAGVAVIPAAFAALGPCARPLSGCEFLTAIAIGYEIALRTGIAQHVTAAEYHSSGSWNALGCAALTARLLGLSEKQTLHALGIAEYHGPRSPIMRCVEFPTMVKDGSGWGAMCGVSAALLAGKSFTGRPAAIELSAGSDFWADLGRRWRFLEIYFKPHGVCRWAQPAVEGALAILREQGVVADDIVGLRIDTFREATRLITRTPQNSDEAQYSLPFSVAAALVFGRLGPEELTGGALTDHRVLRLARLVNVAEDPKISRLFPTRRVAHVTIKTRDGRCCQIHDVQPSWEAIAPPSDAELLAKFRWLAKSLPESDRSDLERQSLNCADAEDMASLADLLARTTFGPPRPSDA